MEWKINIMEKNVIRKTFDIPKGNMMDKYFDNNEFWRDM